MVTARVIVVQIEHINIDVLDKLIEEERNEFIGFLGSHGSERGGPVVVLLECDATVTIETVTDVKEHGPLLVTGERSTLSSSNFANDTLNL